MFCILTPSTAYKQILMKFSILKRLSLTSTLLLLMGWSASQALASIDVFEFKSDVDRARYEQFIDEMRCPKCQNQSLSGSDSPIAADLRREIYTQIEAGRSDKEIVDFMVERYGEFVLYNPRLSSSTLFLWGFPAFLLVAGVIFLIIFVRRRREVAATQALSDAERKKLAELLGDSSIDNQVEK